MKITTDIEKQIDLPGRLALGSMLKSATSALDRHLSATAPEREPSPAPAPEASAPEAKEATRKPQLDSVLKVAEAADAKIIGIGARLAGAGSGTIARSLAAGCAGLGLKTFLVDARAIVVHEEQSPAPGRGELDLSPAAVPAGAGLLEVDMAAAAGASPLDRSQVRSSLASLSNVGERIVVALPPVCTADGRAQQAYLAAAAACDIVFLVLLTGVEQEADAQTCVQISSLADIMLGGVILNDRGHRAARLLRTTTSL